MVEIAFRVGDIVALRDRFYPCGRVLASGTVDCQVTFGATAETVSVDTMILLAFHNTSNLRLVAQKIDRAGEQVPQFDLNFRYAAIAFAQGGAIAARAFADYVLKMPESVLVVALTHLQQTQLSMSDAAAQVLNLEFTFLAQA